jgi:hypothetical protein
MMARGEKFYNIYAKSIFFAMEKTKNTPAFFLYHRSRRRKKVLQGLRKNRNRGGNINCFRAPMIKGKKLLPGLHRDFLTKSYHRE